MISVGQECIYCGILTLNPKFCSRSCAAAYNNKFSPKRKPEGKCSHCGTPITTKKRLCQKCKSLESEITLRKRDNIHTFQGPSGVFEKRLPNISCYENYVFSNSLSGQLSKENTCEELIDSLLSLLRQSPRYVSDTDVHWLSGMLCHLLESEIDCRFLPSRNKSLIAKIPIKFISNCLENWVWSLFEHNCHPLLPSFALATCQFIDRHLFGYRSHDNHSLNWKIKPWLEGGLNNNFNERGIRFLHNPTFKSNFTQRTGDLYISCKIPEKTIFKISDFFDASDIQGPTNFDLQVTHCYLSQNLLGYYSIRCKIQECNEARFDILSDAQFAGTILQAENLEGKHFNIRTYVPISWAIGTKPHRTDLPILALPNWLTGS